ncbi:hypothetical protein [Pseudomonas fluorescens]|uniref:hypothetical protein n=1 Tax=Pseudomonas fluorescens TaxID=294 RepID=UPI0012414D00|nr:hypothetical protein [Pseudomonas fluorescens]
MTDGLRAWRGKRSKARAKIVRSRPEPSAAPVGSRASSKKWVGCQAAFASRLAPTEQQEQEQEQEQKIAAFGSSYSWIVGIWEKWVARLAAFASRLAPTKAKAKAKAKQSKANQSSAAARGKAAPLNNERKLEYRF